MKNFKYKLILFFLPLFMLSAFASGSYATMPTPNQKDQFLIGVTDVVIDAHTAFDMSLIGSEVKIPPVDYKGIEKNVVKQLQTTYSKVLADNVSVQTMSDFKKEGRSPTENTLIISFTLGYRVTKLDNHNFILGAGFLSIYRALPKNLESVRSSGFHERLTGSIPPAPFVLSDNGVVNEAELKNAVNHLSWYVFEWLKQAPTNKDKP